MRDAAQIREAVVEFKELAERMAANSPSEDMQIICLQEVDTWTTFLQWIDTDATPRPAAGETE